MRNTGGLGHRRGTRNRVMSPIKQRERLQASLGTKPGNQHRVFRRRRGAGRPYCNSAGFCWRPLDLDGKANVTEQPAIDIEKH